MMIYSINDMEIPGALDLTMETDTELQPRPGERNRLSDSSRSAYHLQLLLSIASPPGLFQHTSQVVKHLEPRAIRATSLGSSGIRALLTVVVCGVHIALTFGIVTSMGTARRCESEGG